MQPERGDAFEAWLRENRNIHDRWDYTDTHGAVRWHTLDHLLDDYRAHADFGVPLGEELPEEAYK